MKIISLSLFCIGLMCSICAWSVDAIPKSPIQTSIKKTSLTNQDNIVLFTPPPGWQLAESNSLPPHVRVMVVGKGPSAFPPSMNLSWEPYQGTLRQYLTTVKNFNTAKGDEWKELGSIKTEAGIGNLSQVDTKNQWGDVRFMHVILKKNEHMYILTASALKNEFSLFYKDFFTAMRSLRVADNVFDLVINPEQRKQLKIDIAKLQKEWEKFLKEKYKKNPDITWNDLKAITFKSEEYQNVLWKPFQAILKQKYSNLGEQFYSIFLQKIEEQFINTPADDVVEKNFK